MKHSLSSSPALSLPSPPPDYIGFVEVVRCMVNNSSNACSQCLPPSFPPSVRPSLPPYLPLSLSLSLPPTPSPTPSLSLCQEDSQACAFERHVHACMGSLQPSKAVQRLVDEEDLPRIRKAYTAFVNVSGGLFEGNSLRGWSCRSLAISVETHGTTKPSAEPLQPRSMQTQTTGCAFKAP